MLTDMNSNQNLTVFKKKMRQHIALASLVFFSVYLALSIVYDMVCSDIVLSITLLPTALNTMVSLCDVVAYGVCFSLLLYSIYVIGVKPSLSLVYVYCGAVLVKYIANIALHILVFKSAPYVADYIYVLIIWALEVLLTVAVLFIIKISLTKQQGKTVAFTKLFSTSNPLQVTSLAIAVFISATKLVQRLVYDISYGAPSGISEFLWILGAYLSDILILFIVYLVCNFTIRHIYNKNSNI